MKRLVFVSLLVFFGVISMQCQMNIIKPFPKISLNDLKALNLGNVTKIEIKKKIGIPDETEKSKWIYNESSTPKLWFFFKGNKLKSISWSIWEQDPVSNINVLLNNFGGNWKVIKEPMSNPHSAPSICFLEDLKKGRRVEVSAYKKSATDIVIWKPSKSDKSIKQHLLKKVGKKFCIAGHCSRVTDPNAWKHNHCEWLEQIVAKRQNGVRKKRYIPKKTNKNNSL